MIWSNELNASFVRKGGYSGQPKLSEGLGLDKGKGYEQEVRFAKR